MYGFGNIEHWSSSVDSNVYFLVADDPFIKWRATAPSKSINDV
jgi:hypothetical protein